MVPSQDSFPTLPPLRELRALHRREFAPEISERQARCGQHLAPTRLLEFYGGQNGRAYATGLEVCGSWSACPSCGDRICRQRGRDIQRAIDAHRDSGGEVWLLTVTIPHHAGLPLKTVLNGLNESFRRLKSGRAWVNWERSLGLLGTIRGTDATHGRNGWHPHIHCLLFVERRLHDFYFSEFIDFLRSRWEAIVARWTLDDAGTLVYGPAGQIASPVFGPVNWEHGVVLQRGERAGSYVAKMGLGKETATMTIKRASGGHRTPLQILADYYYDRRQADAKLWIEWCRTMKGRRHVYWSPGLRQRFLTGASRPDEEVSADPGDVESDPYLFAVEPTLCAKLADVMGSTCERLEREIAGAYEIWGLEKLGPLLSTLLSPEEGVVDYDREDRVFWWRRCGYGECWRSGTDPGLTPCLSARARKWLDRGKLAAECSTESSTGPPGDSAACSAASMDVVLDLLDCETRALP